MNTNAEKEAANAPTLAAPETVTTSKEATTDSVGQRSSRVKFVDYGNGYVGAEQCLAAIFPDPASRPSLRTFKTWQASGVLPYLKLRKMVRFNPVEVRLALEKKFSRRVKA